MSPFFIRMSIIAVLGVQCIAQTPDSLVLQGRTFLVNKDITNANARFSAAVTASPTHPTGNALFAATRLLSWPYSRAAQDMLDRLGVAQTNRSIYRWTARLPKDTNGMPILPNDLNSSEIIALARTSLLSEVTGAAGNLARIADPNFVLNLASNETTSAQVTVDYGDIRMLRALLHTGEFLIYTINSYNWSAQLNALYALQAQGEFTIDHLLANYPLALTFATPGDLAMATNSFANAVDSYLAASQFIRTRPTNIVRLFNYDPEMREGETRFRQTLIELKASLAGPVALTYVTNATGQLRFNMARAFDGSKPVRSLLPSFQNGGILIGSLPDPTFNGVVFGFSESDFYRLLGSRARLLPSFRPVYRSEDGRLVLNLNAADGRNYLIEASTDLKTWAEIGISTATNGLITLSDTETKSLNRRFYRTLDASRLVSFEGMVLDSATGKPIPGAVVSSWVDAHTALTGATGHFFLQTRQESRTIGFYSLAFTAAGYAPTQAQGFYSAGNHLAGLRITLFPL